MKSLRRASVATTAAVLLGALATAAPGTAATAAPRTAAATPCTTQLQSVTSGGDATYTPIAAANPPTAKTYTDRHLFTPGAAKIAGSWNWEEGITSSYVVLGSALYGVSYGVSEVTGEPYLNLDRVGGGWDKFTYFEQAFWGRLPAARGAYYGLRNDGVLFRWTKWSNPRQYPGFASVKTMALISATKTYDTFLANTRGGALYTIHIPADTRLQPTVKKVRSSTWQGFETLVAEHCGAQSTLLTAIDKDSGNAYLYAVSHANGAATVIQGLGKVPGTYRDPVVSRWHRADGPDLNGE